MPERPFPWLGRKHRDNTLTLKRFSSGVGFWCLGGAAAKTTVKNPWTWSAMTNFLVRAGCRKRGSPTLLGDKRIEGSVWPKIHSRLDA